MSPSGFIAHSAEFAAVLGANPRLDRVADVDAHEGPVYIADEDALYFTTLPRPGGLPLPGSPLVAIKRLRLDSARSPMTAEGIDVVVPATDAANGMVADSDGSLLVCEQGTAVHPARISRVDRLTGERRTVVETWRGLALNSPNDIVVRSDGSIWFTDPSYGHLQGFRPPPSVGDYVYRHDPCSGETSVVVDSMDKPNGIVFAPDESVLYVTDSGANQEPGSYYPDRPHHILAFDVLDGRHLGPSRLFAVVAPGFPDGLKVDTEGRVYASSFSGVQVFAADGDLIGEIALPGVVNFTFGGRDNDRLFITTDSAVWAASLGTRGPDTRRPELLSHGKGA